MTGRSQLPVWTIVSLGEDLVYEAVDSSGRPWRIWFVQDATPLDPFPPGWRFAPVEALDEVNFIEHVGGGREFDIAAVRIDAGEVASNPEFRHLMGWDEPAGGRLPVAGRLGDQAAGSQTTRSSCRP